MLCESETTVMFLNSIQKALLEFGLKYCETAIISNAYKIMF